MSQGNDHLPLDLCFVQPSSFANVNFSTIESDIDTDVFNDFEFDGQTIDSNDKEKNKGDAETLATKISTLRESTHIKIIL